MTPMSMGYSACEDPRMRQVWQLYVETDGAPTMGEVVSPRNWRGAEEYLAIAEQLTAAALGLA